MNTGLSGVDSRGVSWWLTKAGELLERAKKEEVAFRDEVEQVLRLKKVARSDALWDLATKQLSVLSRFIDVQRAKDYLLKAAQREPLHYELNRLVNVVFDLLEWLGQEHHYRKTVPAVDFSMGWERLAVHIRHDGQTRGLLYALPVLERFEVALLRRQEEDRTIAENERPKVVLAGETVLPITPPGRDSECEWFTPAIALDPEGVLWVTQQSRFWDQNGGISRIENMEFSAYRVLGDLVHARWAKSCSTIER